MRKFTLAVDRAGASSTTTAGKVVNAPPSTFTIQASVQPIMRKDMQLDPNLRDKKEAFKLFTDTLLLTADAPVQEADKVTVNGNVLEVQSSDPWKNGIIDHIRVVVSR